MRLAALLALLVACGGDDAPSTIEFTAGDPVTATIGAEGGMLSLPGGEFTLEVPPGALASSIELSLRPLLVDGDLAAIQLLPSGTTFATPAVGRASVDDERSFMPMLISDDGTVDTPRGTIERDAMDRAVVRFDVSHFSTAMAWIGKGSVKGAVTYTTLHQPGPWRIPVGVVVSGPGQFARTGTTTVLVQMVTFNGGVPIATPLPATITSVSGVAGWIAANPVFRVGPPPPSPARDITTAPAGIAPLWVCRSLGSGFTLVNPIGQLELSVTLPASIDVDNAVTTILDPDSGSRFLFIEEALGPVITTDVTCLAGESTVSAMQLAPETFLDGVKAAWVGDCTPLSNGAACEPPKPPETIGVVLDPVLTLGPNAVARFASKFPCGDGPVGKTLCAPGATFTQGDWVFVQATLLDDVKLADPVGRYQFAFVFDADGNAANNYQASAMFPKDFFAGTDKWYEALYTPQAGWSLSVRDTRLGPAQQPSNARFILAGRELALLIPRSELGASPGFRATAFRHEGDFGLMGGPWSGSYFPALGQPLYPAASGAPIVVPE